MKSILCAALLGCALLTSAQAAPVSALTFTSANGNGTSFNTTRGYAFNVTQTGLAATHLGIWDEGANGLSQAHDVGLWKADGTLLASTSIAAGAGALLVDGFRYVDIADIVLDIGTYIVGATYAFGSADRQAYNIGGAATASGITYLGGRFNNNGLTTLSMPTTVFSQNGLIGGTLMVDSAASRRNRKG